MPKKHLKLLVVGTLPPPVGGTTVLVKSLVEGLRKRNNVKTTTINTSRPANLIPEGIARSMSILFRLVTEIPCTDLVTLHVGTNGLAIIGPVVVGLAKLLRKPVIVRKFAGSDYRDLNIVRRALARWALRKASLYLAETKMLVDAAKKDSILHTDWYPNNKPVNKEKTPSCSKRSCRRFVFLGRVKLTKGIREVIEAAELFGPEVSVDIYGPLVDNLTEKIFAGLKRVHYRGIVEPEKVVEVLSQYDAFVLPTYHQGEGYPGAILEAYNADLPVITTRWRALPEIVDETCGLLVEPKNARQLHRAMKAIVEDDELFVRLSQGAQKQREKFSSDRWIDLFVKYCYEVALNKP